MATSRALRLPEADEPHSQQPRPSAARRTVLIRGQVPPPPAATGQLAPPAVGSPEARSSLPVLVPAGTSSRPARPHVDAALARLTRPRPALPAAPPPLAPGQSVTLAYQRRPPRPLALRLAASPDRLAMWAVVMGAFLVLVAALSAHV